MAGELMTIKDVEKRVGVSEVDKSQWTKAVYVGVSTLRAALAMWGVGGSGMAGGAIGGSVLVGGAMGIAAVIAPGAALAGALLSIGIPVAKAKEIVSKKAAKHGYAIGVALGLFNHNGHFASTFLDNTSGSPGITPSYMTGIYKTAFNASLCLGYCTAGQLTQKEKTKMGNYVLRIMIAEAESNGYRLNANRWNERDAVQHFARTFINRVLK